MFFPLLLATTLSLSKAPLPEKWHGTWTGPMTVVNNSPKAEQVPVTLKIERLNGGAVSWVITYNPGPKAIVKDYKLLPIANKPGYFEIDEQNGIRLPCRMVRNVLYSQFSLGDISLTARYELRGEELLMEVTSAKPSPEKTGGDKVQPYLYFGIQSAALKKN
ncbi:MAG: hypothetical protein ACRC8S_22185 [Fimbriiglobus sp.]